MMQNQVPQPSTILFTHYGDDWIRGSERCLLDLISNLDRQKYLPIVWCNSQVFEDEVIKLGVQVHRYDFTVLFGWQEPRFDFANYFKLIELGKTLVEQHKVQLIHANSAAPNQWLSSVAQQTNTPLVCHLHARYVFRDRWLLKSYLADVLIGVSPPVIEQYQADGLSANQLKVIANGIDVDRLEVQPLINVREQLNICPEDIVLVTIASLIERKGVDLLIQALKKVQLQLSQQVHLLVMGEGPQKAQLKQLTQELNLYRHVHFLSECRYAFGIMKASGDLFVSGAREEVFGLVLAEANLANLPVIAPAVGGIPSVIKPHLNGLLVPPEDPQAMAESIVALLADKDRQNSHYSQIKAQARNHVLQHFTIQQNVSAIEDVYAELLDSKAIRPSQAGFFARQILGGKFVLNYLRSKLKQRLNARTKAKLDEK